MSTCVVIVGVFPTRYYCLVPRPIFLSTTFSLSACISIQSLVLGAWNLILSRNEIEIKYGSRYIRLAIFGCDLASSEVDRESEVS